MKVIITGACAVSARSVLRSLKMSPLFESTEFVGWDMCNLLYGVYEGIFDRIYKVPAVSDVSYRAVVEDIRMNMRFIRMRQGYYFRSVSDLFICYNLNFIGS